MTTEEQMPRSDLSVVEKAAVLMEALPYVRKFRQSTFVIKYGGSCLEHPDAEARSRVAADVTFLNSVGIRVVIVHGGGKAISRELVKRNLEPVFMDGLRVTDAETLAVARDVLDGEVNRDICERVESRQGQAEGLSGADTLRCIPMPGREGLGYVGQIVGVEIAPINAALDAGRIPVISCLASAADGQIYNTNADTAAGKVALALGARRLVYLSDVPGLLRNPDDAGTMISTLPVSEVESLKDSGVISKGMRPKVDSAVEALAEGVKRVHFVDGRMPHSLLLEIFTDEGIGTEIVR
ncbi:MAG: acetylglutamate kinase [Opitutales bacterium]